MGIDLPLCFQDIDGVLEVIIKNEKLENPKVTYLPGSKIGEGYLGINSAVELSDGNRTMHLFVKAAPKHEKLRQIGSLKEAYGCEFNFYNVIYPILDEFYKNKTGKSLELVPKFYAGSVEEMKEVFVFENLIKEGFSLSKDKHVFNKEETLLMMKKYGILHGTSFALKDQKKQTFNDITKDLPQDLLTLLYDKMSFGSILETNRKVLENYLQSPEDSILLEKMAYILENARNMFLKQKEYNGEHAVISHGDCNHNNMMFRYKGTHLELRLVDFQGLKLTSPVFDLSYFFYCSASSEENLTELNFFLQTYYDSLSSTIKELGSDPEKVCPFLVIKEHWKKFSMFGLIMAIILLPSMLNDGEPHDIVKSIEDPAFSEMRVLIYNESEYAKRVKSLLHHFVNNKFI